MAIKVKYLTEDEIETDAKLLLAEYEDTIGEPIKLPVPVDEITTYHLALRLGFDDLHKTLNRPMLSSQPDILGAIFVEKELVLIDQHLNPKHNPSMLGRYRFSVTHEIGHWRLHRHLFAKDRAQATMFGRPAAPSFICRSSEAWKREEWQADFYSSCLLMPRKLVFQAWRDRFGNDHPRGLRRKDGTVDVDEISRMLPNFLAVPVGISDSPNRACDDQLLKHIARPFAEQFLVSPIAMRIRLERLGLLHREVPRQQSLLVRSRPKFF
jgi:Zn-dependent peptidase ImmA (M78 family)